MIRLEFPKSKLRKLWLIGELQLLQHEAEKENRKQTAELAERLERELTRNEGGLCEPRY